MLDDKSLEFKIGGNCHGFLLKTTTFQDYLRERVKEKFEDVEGQLDAMETFGDLAETEFETSLLEEILSGSEKPRHWKIGECLAECYLEDFENGLFPFNPDRDAKNPNGSPHGCDIVGFHLDKEDTSFLFSEVKTSSDMKSPPSVVSNDTTGLKYQLRTLRDDEQTRFNLIKWLIYKTKDLPEESEILSLFKKTLKSYFKNKKKVKLVGMIIRDIEPKEADFKNLNTFIHQSKPSDMTIDLIGLYLPFENIKMEDEIDYE
jgi:hypothetical protein